MVGAGLCSARQNALIFTKICGEFALFCGRRYILQCRKLILEICDCPSAFSFASPKENAGKRKRARGDFDFPPDPLEPTKKTASVFLDLSREICNSSEFRTRQGSTERGAGAPRLRGCSRQKRKAKVQCEFVCTKGSPWAQGELSAKLTEGIRTSQI